ncbi:MAG: hypothetical protein B6U86_01810 [Candidatus Altiarchaeales archaeon ex4484_43]|nr:MAG: hypothetical protein B6U86_01810 [Candidatus Altiarchaeales archaeon ex4484_43]RLI89786.1 MAG: hypothetical protein DRO62_00840 [Candidatus Altiarchaeales archaeon]
MKIDHYEFGKVVIDGEEYTNDVVITEDGIMDKWWRKEGHKLQVEDIYEILDKNPDVLIVGTGYSGYMDVLPETREFIKSRGVELIIEKTTEACELYNEISGNKRVVAALHLTC